MDTNGPSGNRKVSTMLSRPPTLNENNRRWGLSAVGQPPVHPVVQQTGFSSSHSPPLPPSALTSSVQRPRLASPSPFIRPPSRSPHHPISVGSPSPLVVSSRPPPSVNLSLSTHTSLSSVSPSTPTRPSPPPRVSPSSHPSPPSLLGPRFHHPPSFSSDLPPRTNHLSPVFSSAPPSSLPSLAPSSVNIPPSTIPPPPPAQCTCSSLLPRLLSAHRLEVRRLLRGALASIGRRLDVLERRSRMKKKMRMTGGGGGACSHAPAASSSSNPASSSSYSSSSLPSFPSPPPSISAFVPVVPPSSSPSLTSDSEDSSTSPPRSFFNQSEQTGGDSQGNEEEKVRGRKRRRRSREGDELEEKDVGRFVGQMAVSFREGGAKEEGPITLHNFNHRKHRRVGQSGQSEKSDSIVRHNGFRPLLLHSILGSSSQEDIHLLQSAQSLQAFSQSDATTSQLWFSDLSAFGMWLRPSSSSLNPASLLRLSAVALDTVMDSIKDGTCLSPLRPLRDWTAPPSVGADHCYMRAPSLSLMSSQRQHKQRSNRSTRSLQPSWRRSLPLPPCPVNGLTASFTASTTEADPELDSSKKEHGKRVSQIRIRRASPRETSLTPMGLPKVKRLKKKEFSLEEIYTNKNYKSPANNRSLETIFEEPRGKNGALLLIGHQRRRRVLLFPDFTQPRKRKRPQGAWFPGSLLPRKRAAARRHLHGSGCGDDDLDLDVMLVERLSALEDFLLQQGLDT